MTGILITFLSAFSILKHSGALISSKLIPPKVGSKDLTISINLSGSVSLTSISKTSIPANFLKRTPLPSITGLEASGPIFPSPNTAVPLVITPTRLPLAVYLYTSCLLLAISKQGTATPGEYANAKSCWLLSGLVGITSILPRGGASWKSNASCFLIFAHIVFWLSSVALFKG